MSHFDFIEPFFNTLNTRTDEWEVSKELGEKRRKLHKWLLEADARANYTAFYTYYGSMIRVFSPRQRRADKNNW